MWRYQLVRSKNMSFSNILSSHRHPLERGVKHVTMLLGSLASAVSDNDNVLAEETTTVSTGKVRQGKRRAKGCGFEK
jgi:hypothetical protein